MLFKPIKATLSFLPKLQERILLVGKDLGMLLLPGW